MKKEITIHKQGSKWVMHTKFLLQKPQRKGTTWSSVHTQRIGTRESNRSDKLNRIHLTEDGGPLLMNRAMYFTHRHACVCVCVGVGEGVTWLLTNYQFVNNNFSPWRYGQSSPYTFIHISDTQLECEAVINFSLVRRNTKSEQAITFPCFIILSSLRNWYQPILAYSHHGGNKRLNTYITKCHTLSAHQTKTQYCILDTDGRHVYTVTANQNIGGMIRMVMFDFQTDTVMCKH